MSAKQLNNQPLNRVLNLQQPWQQTLRLLLVGTLATLLSACSGLPEQSVTPQQPFEADSDQAIVLISLHIDEAVAAINQQQIPVHRGPSRLIIALYAETDSVFTLNRITLRNPAQNPRSIFFADTRALQIDEPGIYFYGNIVKSGEKVYLDYMLKQQLIDQAHRRYPDVFEQLETKNF